MKLFLIDVNIMCAFDRVLITTEILSSKQNVAQCFDFEKEDLAVGYYDQLPKVKVGLKKGRLYNECV